MDKVIGRLIIDAGVQDCPKCGTPVLVWTDGTVQWFDVHYAPFPAVCNGEPVREA